MSIRDIMEWIAAPAVWTHGHDIIWNAMLLRIIFFGWNGKLPWEKERGL
jgi:hypothetical protein